MSNSSFSQLAKAFEQWHQRHQHEVKADAMFVHVRDRCSNIAVKIPFSASSFPVAMTNSSKQS